MQKSTNDTRLVDGALALGEKAFQLANQLPDLLQTGNSGKEILDQLAPLLRQLMDECSSSPQKELSPPVRAILAKVIARVEEAKRQAANWMGAASPRLTRMARIQKMQRAYGSRRF